MNSLILIGRLAKQPEMSYTPNTQTAVTRFTLAVDRPRRNSEDAGADFIRITVFSKQAESCSRYLNKGSQCAVLGRIQTGSYTNKDGVTIYTTDVIAERVQFLGSPAQAEAEPPREADKETGQASIQDCFEAAEGELPF